jgi:hypothetical protein
MLLAIALIMVEKISGYTATLSIVFMQYLQDIENWAMSITAKTCLVIVNITGPCDT